MKNGDVLYVPATGLTKLNYKLDEIVPFLRVINLSNNVMGRHLIGPNR